MQTLVSSGKLESTGFPQRWFMYLLCVYIFIRGVNTSHLFLQSSYQEPSRKINVLPICHDRIRCKLCKPISIAFRNPILCLSDRRKLHVQCKTTNCEYEWCAKVHKSGLSLSEMPNILYYLYAFFFSWKYFTDV